jgi:hypothetical protein
MFGKDFIVHQYLVKNLIYPVKNLIFSVKNLIFQNTRAQFQNSSNLTVRYFLGF